MREGITSLRRRDLKRVAEFLTKDVVHRFSIPMSPEAIEKIKGAMVQPLGLATQFALAEDGSIKVKHQLKQDLSFSLTTSSCWQCIVLADLMRDQANQSLERHRVRPKIGHRRHPSQRADCVGMDDRHPSYFAEAAVGQI